MNDKPNFLDRGTIMAICIVVVFWMGWQKFMDTKYPQPAPGTPVAGASPAEGTAAAVNAQNPAIVSTTPANTTPAVPVSNAPEKKIDISDANWSLSISSHGMGVENIVLKNYLARNDKPEVLAEAPSRPAFATGLVGVAAPLDFQIEQTATDTFVGHASVGDMQIEKTLKLDSSKNKITTTLHAIKVSPQFKGFTVSVDDALKETIKEGYLAVPPEFQTWYISGDKDHARKPVHKKDGLNLSQENVDIAALSEHYFSLAMADNSPLHPKFDLAYPAGSDVVIGTLSYIPVSPNDTFDIRYTAYAGPKLFSHLTDVDEKLGKVIDYGTFSILAKPILQLLHFIYENVMNWGWAIIILTIVVRMIVLPFSIYSYKSMKIMQKLQPEMTRIREKYKDANAEKKVIMNQEIMQLMKSNKASPLGSCLPTVLQLPILWALYQVLGQSFELYRAPFIFWIHDLTARDPYFVLPISMAAVMVIQQKMTPTTMDPQQAKIMMFVPAIFALVMISLPSGLTLYMFVSTLFGIIQQLVFMRDRSRASVTKVAKA